jgi:DNA repair/transcription protein MET18/MMS19
MADRVNLEIVLNKIFTTTIGTLLNRDSTLFKPTMELVIKCAEASDVSCVYVVNKILPITITDLTSNEEITETEKVDVLGDFLKFTSIIVDKSVLSEYAHDNYMAHIQKELMKLLITPGSAELISTIWKILANLTPILSDESRQIIYAKLKRDLMKSTKDESDCLLALARSFPNEVHQIVLDEFLSRKYEDPTLARNTFKTLSALLAIPTLCEHIIEVMCINLFNNNNLEVQTVILEVLKGILMAPKSSEIAKTLFNEWKIVVKLMDLIRNANAETSQELMYQASLVMNLIVKSLPHDQQMELVDKYLPLMKLQSSISDLYVTSGILGFLDAAIPIESHFEQLVNELTNLSLTSGDEQARKIANQLLCSLFNRAPIDDKHRKVLRKLYELLKDEIKKHNHQAVEILGWISKGLLARGHPDAAEILETLAELLDHPKLSKAATLAFEIISLEFPHLHLPLLKHLFKQKIFVLAMKFLEDKIEKFSEHHLTAMAHVLQITPHIVLKMNIDKVGPILFKCIETGSDEASPHPKRVLLSLKIFNNFILEKHQFILTNLNKLIKIFLQLVTFKQSMEIRITSCKCLENLIHFPLFTLVPFKNDVTHGLESALDDNKRLVRTAAVDARMAWFLLGENET